MGLIDNIKRIIQGLKKNKEADFISEDGSTLIIEEELTDRQKGFLSIITGYTVALKLGCHRTT